MMIFKDYSAITLLIVVNVASVLCGDKNSNEQSVKPKRAIGTYSYPSLFEGIRIKSSKRLKNAERLDTHDSFLLNNPKDSGSVIVLPKLKTTVEYWPPDMDKEKFFSMKKGSEIQMWPHRAQQDMTRVNQKVTPENLPDVQIKTVSINSWSPIDSQNNFESMISPTESSVAESVSVTDPGPVVFPTMEPSTKDPDQTIVYIARGGYKKRKLKKKAKTSPPIVELSPTKAPSMSTESEIRGEIKASDIYMPQATPIYETVSESVVNVFPSVRYTDVVNNLSNLTEQSFGTSSYDNDTNKQIISNSKPIDEENIVVKFDLSTRADETFKGSKITEEPTTQSAKKPLSMKDIMPLEKLLNQLKQAIEELDIAKIKRIVELMEEPKIETVTYTTTSAHSVEISSKAAMSSEPLTEAPEKKVYLAPRIRIAQRKSLQLNIKSPDDKLKEKLMSIPTVAETFAPSSSTKLMVTTEKFMSTSVLTSLQARRPGRRGGRSKGSKHNPRVEPRAESTTNRHTAKNVSRRVLNKKQS